MARSSAKLRSENWAKHRAAAAPDCRRRCRDAACPAPARWLAPWSPEPRGHVRALIELKCVAGRVAESVKAVRSARSAAAGAARRGPAGSPPDHPRHSPRRRAHPRVASRQDSPRRHALARFLAGGIAGECRRSVDVQAAVDPEDSHHFRHGQLQLLFLDDLAILERHAREGLSRLAAEQQAALVVLVHRYPGTLPLRVGPEHQFELKAVQGLDDVRRILRQRLPGTAPGAGRSRDRQDRNEGRQAANHSSCGWHWGLLNTVVVK